MEKTVGYEKPAKKRLITNFLHRMKINRFVFLAYVIMPALVIVVGFSAWTISGNSVEGSNGFFVASDVINSYDYIQLSKAPNSTGAKFNLFETGFYDPETKDFTTAPSIGIDYEINLRKCFADLLNDETGAIYGVFTLKFPNDAPQNPPDIFTGMTCKINDSVVSDESVITLNSGTLPVTVIKASSTTTEYTALLKFDFDKEKQSAYNVTLNLNMAYTLSPSSATYQELYNYLAVDTQKKLAVDVKITKTNPLNGN